MTEGIWAAIIGVVGTLLGTFLGWILNSLSNSGSLRISLVNCLLSFEKNTLGYMSRCTLQNSECFSICLKINIYNNSLKRKIMNDIKIEFLDKNKKTLKTVIPYDDDFTTHSTITHHERISPLNINANTVLEKTLKWFVWKSEESYDYLLETKKIILQYTNYKGRTQKVLLKNISNEDFLVQIDEGSNE